MAMSHPLGLRPLLQHATRAWCLALLALCGVCTTSLAAGRISAGAYNGYAVDADGSVWVWGANVYGQICDGTTNHRYTPTRIPGLASVAQVSAGGSHGLARTQDGALASWGLNSQDSTGRGGGQLGDGSRTNRGLPVAVQNAAGITQVVAGAYHSLAVQGDGSVLAWGFNQQGQLGDGGTQTRDTPVAVAGATGIRALAGGCLHSLALKNDGTVLAWGFNSTGQLGDGTSTNRLPPVPVSGLSNVVAIAAGCSHSVALKADGTVWAWGFNFEGQLGAATSAILQRTPVKVGGLSGISAIASGNDHTLALGSDGRVWAWGKNDKGQLGDGSTSNRNVATVVAGLPTATEVAAGQNFSVSLASNGQVFTWGQNDLGQLGNGSSQNSATPTASRDASGAEFRLSLAQASTVQQDADKVFAWAERTYPDFFAPTPAVSSDALAGLRLRSYAGSRSYLGVNTTGISRLYYLGPLSGDTVVDLGLLAEWLARAGLQ
ncbi:MAG: hypothetical protein CFE44_01995 [Burkholderiales bacterium PBB4]|nr:MAG: hypothetical protein CFE44_01995 [Burkholderiales bacterium PBB4]